MRRLVLLLTGLALQLQHIGADGPLPAAPTGVQCSGTSSTNLMVQWNPLSQPELVDALYVAVFAVNRSSQNRAQPVPALQRPFLLQTVYNVSTTSLTVTDLSPEYSYLVALRAHAVWSPHLGWFWSNYSNLAACQTQARPAVQLQRAPTTAPSLNRIYLQISRLHSARMPIASRVAWARVGHWQHDVETAADLTNWPGRELVSRTGTELSDLQWQWRAVEPHAQQVTVEGLPSGSTFVLVLEDVLANGTLRYSDAIWARTAANDTRYTEMFRISEYTFDVDFLSNHNLASRDSMGAYIYQGNPFNTSTFWPESTTKDWNDCQALLAQLCPDSRATGLSCMTCVEQYRPQVTAVCGNFTYEDVPTDGFSVHFYCGTGWPESVVVNSSISAYCIADTPMPDSYRSLPSQAGATPGWAQYVSCNSDETDYFSNQPRDPVCICWVYDDRILSQQNMSQLQAHCDFANPEPYVNETLCGCGPNGALLTPDNPSTLYVGQSPVFLPYGYWLDKTPPAKYPVTVPAGENYSLPKMGQCRPGQTLGDKCMWQADSRVAILYGQDLLENGWIIPIIPDTLTNFTSTQHNMQVFEQAVANLDRYINPRCCGC